MCLITSLVASSCQSPCSVVHSGIAAFWKICFNEFYHVVVILAVIIPWYIKNLSIDLTGLCFSSLGI